uniref:uncharacterized protein LOC122597009 n=1 Tax=Erigeron canadensis TaxID=72917 RepID=UPI001CB8E030|nr:uncharacterized protein LOC122597009 [Erigeron canadensis]
MTSHIWAILNNRESLWVKWVYDYKLKGRSFWDIPLHSGVSWGWRKLLQLRPNIRPHIRSQIGNGMDTSIWFDSWCPSSPTIQHVTPRAIASTGFSMQNTVADLYENGEWKFPVAWYDLFPVLISLPSLHLQDRSDSLLWRDHLDRDMNYSSTNVWDTIRHKGNVVTWVNLVWFPQCIPRHAFHLWLVMRKKLKTQDRMKYWDAGSETNLRLMCCSFCQRGLDSHSHLFFECEFSSLVWNEVKSLADLQHLPNQWEAIVSWMIAQQQQNTAQIIIAKLVLAAVSYFVWQERNNRLFSTKKRSAMALVEVIKYTVRLKLLSMRFKNTNRVQHLLEKWKLPRRLTFDNG